MAEEYLNKVFQNKHLNFNYYKGFMIMVIINKHFTNFIIIKIMNLLYIIDFGKVNNDFMGHIIDNYIMSKQLSNLVKM